LRTEYAADISASMQSGGTDGNADRKHIVIS